MPFAGLDKLNISLDSLHAPLFAKLTRRDALPRVLAAIDLALSLGFSPLKVNCVLMAGVNEHELLDFAAFAIEKQIDVRTAREGRWEEGRMGVAGEGEGRRKGREECEGRQERRGNWRGGERGVGGGRRMGGGGMAWWRPTLLRAVRYVSSSTNVHGSVACTHTVDSDCV